MPPANVSDLGLTSKAIHEARQLRDAEAVDPGVIRRTLNARLTDGQEPTKAGDAASAAALARVEAGEASEHAAMIELGLRTKPHSAAAAFFGLRALAGLAAGSAAFFRPRAFGASVRVSPVSAAFAAALRRCWPRPRLLASAER